MNITTEIISCYQKWVYDFMRRSFCIFCPFFECTNCKSANRWRLLHSMQKSLGLMFLLSSIKIQRFVAKIHNTTTIMFKVCRQSLYAVTHTEWRKSTLRKYEKKMRQLKQFCRCWTHNFIAGLIKCQLMLQRFQTSFVALPCPA